MIRPGGCRGPGWNGLSRQRIDSGESDPDAVDTDHINNVEAVHLAEPCPEIIRAGGARNVVQDSRLDTQAIDQDFAFVISGNFPALRRGIVLLDRSEYTRAGTNQNGGA